MNNSHPKRRPLSMDTELLESRQMLNAHLPHHPAVHVAPASGHVVAESTHGTAIPRQISGILTGQAPYTTNPSNPAQGNDSYTLSGQTKFGSVSYTGQDAFTSTLLNKTTYSDVYYGGNATMTLKDGSTIAISYVGTGHSPVENGPFKATIQGEAIGTSGSALGHVYSFKASGAGNEVDSSFAMKFTLKG